MEEELKEISDQAIKAFEEGDVEKSIQIIQELGFISLGVKFGETISSEPAPLPKRRQE